MASEPTTPPALMHFEYYGSHRPLDEDSTTGKRSKNALYAVMMMKQLS